MTKLSVRSRFAMVLGTFLALGVAGCAPAPTDAPTDTDAPLRSSLAAHRELQIERLRAYAAAGEFPHNVTSPEAIHLFRDADGRYCAVANLVHQDGRDDLVAAIVRDQNDLAIHDVHEGPMMAWILESGLTQEELAEIQLPNVPFTRLEAPRPAPKRPTPVDEVAKKPTEAPPLRTTVAAVDEDALKALVRTHVARVEASLRAHTDESLGIAVARARAAPTAPGATTRVASR